ncbi:MAG: hypothetical protein QOJ98_2506, partial [Acidobacteriota bacterium]|nr:hypothetical protein [Acidobacteriota bacterium]
VGSRVHDIGIYRPQHEWRFDGAISFTSIDAFRNTPPSMIAEAIREVEGEAPQPKPRGRR